MRVALALWLAACGRIDFDVVADAPRGDVRLVDAPVDPIGVMQTSTFSSVGMVDSTQVTFGSPTTSGDLIVVYAWSSSAANGSDLRATGTTDSNGNSYSLAVSVHSVACNTSGEGAAALYFTSNIPSSASLTIKVDPSGSQVQQLGVVAVEYSGIDTLDTSTSFVTTAGASPLTFSTGTTAMTTVGRELVASVGNACNGEPADVVLTETSGFNVVAKETSTATREPGIATDRAVDATGAYADRWILGYSSGSSSPAIGAIATFR